VTSDRKGTSLLVSGSGVIKFFEMSSAKKNSPPVWPEIHFRLRNPIVKCEIKIISGFSLKF
jgi:hypothetical protein